METIPATYGFPMPKPGYLNACKALCEKYGAMYIADEVQTGLMRTGSMWGWQAYNVQPDIMVTAKGNAKVLDFGLAQWTHGGMLRAKAARNPDAMPPESAAVLGYLSPEQAIGSAVDPRTDVFSIGALTYEMVTGRNPFLGPTAGATVMNVIQGKFAPASQVNPAVPAELDAILAHALNPDLSHRQQSAASLAAELRSVAAMLDVRTGDAATPSALLPIDDSPDRNAAGLLVGALIVAAGAAAGVWWWLSR